MRIALTILVGFVGLGGCATRLPSPKSVLPEFYSSDGCPKTEEIRAMVVEKIHVGLPLADAQGYLAAMGASCGITPSGESGTCELMLGCADEILVDFTVAQEALTKVDVKTGNYYY